MRIADIETGVLSLLAEDKNDRDLLAEWAELVPRIAGVRRMHDEVDELRLVFERPPQYELPHGP